MMGCLRSVVAGVMFVLVVLVGGVVAWQYREPIKEAYRAFRGDGGGMAGGPGGPSDDALASAVDKYGRMARRSGPERVVLDAAEIASLIYDGLDPLGQRALDSLTVTLENGRFIMEAVLVTDVWGKDQLGLLGALLRPVEPLRVAGPAWIERMGVLAWEPTEFAVRAIPFPQGAIPPIVNRLTGGGDGLILIPVPSTVERVEIDGGGAAFYRRER